jgi:hypothetical protein
LDSIDCHASNKVPPAEINLSMVIVKPGGIFEVEPLSIQGSVEMDQQTL